MFVDDDKIWWFKLFAFDLDLCIVAVLWVCGCLFYDLI